MTMHIMLLFYSTFIQYSDWLRDFIFSHYFYGWQFLFVHNFHPWHPTYGEKFFQLYSLPRKRMMSIGNNHSITITMISFIDKQSCWSRIIDKIWKHRMKGLRFVRKLLSMNFVLRTNLCEWNLLHYISRHWNFHTMAYVDAMFPEHRLHIHRKDPLYGKFIDKKCGREDFIHTSLYVGQNSVIESMLSGCSIFSSNNLITALQQ